METKSPTNTNTNTDVPSTSTQTAHSDIPMIDIHHPHTGTGAGTGTGTQNELHANHSEMNIQAPHPHPPPPSYNTHPDQQSSEKTAVENNNHETPPQFQIHPQPSMNADAGGNAGGKYEGQHLAPLATLQKESRLVRCPRCGVCEYTVVEWVSGGTADISALLCCLCFCLPCVPYLMTSFKDVHHKCVNCGFLVAIWKRSGKTEVSVAASAAAASGGAGGTGGAGGK
ncbi:hypothetical protein BOTCAL_0338g00090 [Botryotinia calthae]|uniref:LITAF domain-containing protein n=1 Tax=Botryotinia calthae TaxID=38488 RepID=A0A4Y8CSY0_9HELO|nr:hypothetical protein BOTCAL_0338g00090 [Botryotinia calthae]